MRKADYIFETSWEVCNKVGGIHTVVATKAPTITRDYKDNYICIGPDIAKEGIANEEFEEDNSLYGLWREVAAAEGLRIRIGRWKISGSPVVVLVNFTPFFENKNEILTHFWEKYRLDSISGQWDYIEPVLFGYAAGRVIESFYQFHCTAHDKIVAQFHEWMTGTGILYIKENVPQVATVFTTHATVLGRCIAGNGLPLYESLSQYEPAATASRFGVQSKASLEYLSAQTADSFTTVSEITNKECAAFLEKPADTITINGFENDFVPQGDEYAAKRAAAKKKLHAVAEALLQQPISKDALFVVNSGRYEFKNKGIDIFLEALANMKDESLPREVVAFIAVPAGYSGQRQELVSRLEKEETCENCDNAHLRDYATHPLHDPYNDPIIKRCNELNLDNAPERKVKVIFVPTYLNGHDGIFNLNYYDFLIGFDLSVFPSYYEPWGYTPLESVAFGIPTVTTSLAGFGLWARDNFGGTNSQKAVWVIERTDHNDEQVYAEIAHAISYYANCSEKENSSNSEKAVEISQSALWKNLFDNYLNAYDLALEKSEGRFEIYKNKTSKIDLMVSKIEVSEPKWRRITFKSQLTNNLQKLYKLAHNLWWSWNYEARELFMEIAGPELWAKYNENPVHLLQFLPLDVIEKYSSNPDFMAKLEAVYQKFQDYMNTPRTRPEEKVAYFSMEFGISNELKIFSGGLGMLAGDYLKEASDCNVNMIAVGLLYRCGYFTQQISPYGEQVNLYPNQSFSKLPMSPVKNEDGEFEKISIGLPGRTLYARIWRVDVGRIPLYLLDTDFRDNSDEDRKTTYQLYGGDWENRLKQEFLLGIGGIRMLRKLGEKPTVYHLNEGHAAFLNLERLSNVMQEEHLTFSTAVEVVKASSLFTTHTPVPAGHDAFSEDMMRIYFANYPEKCNISWKTFMGLGRKNSDSNDKFSMSILACKLSQEINGVSRIHGRVSREMFQYLYDGHFSNELHISYVTNGVHYPTWAHKRWQQFHAKTFGGAFLSDQSNPDIWAKIKAVDDASVWQIKDDLRKELMAAVKVLLEEQMRRRNESPALIVKTLDTLRDDILTIGFARRFATYKRAHLLFSDEERLRRLLNNPEKPVQFIFAGKAHPHDKAGQDLIKRIIDFSRKPDFIGKIIFLENYDMILAKKLVSGCDVWMNTPTRPLEASGTSGEKAIMNGVLNLSVLDGWWAEGYVKGAGWAINEEITYTDNRLQDELDAATIYSLIEGEISNAFYGRTADGVPTKWVEMMKNNFALISPHFTMKRQLDDYYGKFYHKLEKRTKQLSDNNFENAKNLVRWKEKIITSWGNIEFVDVQYPQCEEEHTYALGKSITTTLRLRIGNLTPDDLKIEFVFATQNDANPQLAAKYPFRLVRTEGNVSVFECAIDAKYAGVWNCAIRIIPANPLLPHDMDFNLVKWM